jgi:sialate O-acetylesterase
MPLHKYPFGVLIDSGLEDWQIVQRDTSGKGRFMVRGRVVAEAEGKVEVRVVGEDTGRPVTKRLDWRRAMMTGKRTWRAEISGIPSGGLYRLETRWREVGRKEGEWSMRGDLRRFLGVGDLWVIAGQSNAAGYGRGYYHESPELGIHVFGNNHRWSLASHPLNDSTDSRQVISDDAANNGHSPYLEVARILKRELHCPIGLIQTAVGGTSLDAWNPAGGNAAPLFAQLKAAVKKVGGGIRGMFWCQGENEAIKIKSAAKYLPRFLAAVRAWRRELRQPDLPILTVQLNRYHLADSVPENEVGWSILREAQRQAAHRLNNVHVTSSLDLPLSDFIHNSPGGYHVLAGRIGLMALGGAYGRPHVYKCPEIVKARRILRGTKVRLTFQNVSGRLDTVDVTARPFLVEDREGRVPVVQITYPFPAQIVLHLGRPLRGPATVQAGTGLNPATVPMDFERAAPLLAFYRFGID